MVYYEGTDLLAPEDDSYLPRCHAAFEDDSSSDSGMELQTDSRPRSNVEIPEISVVPLGQRARPALTATGGRYGRQCEFYVKRLRNGDITDMSGTPIVINPPHNAPIPVISRARRALDQRPSRPLRVWGKGQQHGISTATPLSPRPTTAAPKIISLLPPRAKPTPPSLKIKLSQTKKGITNSKPAKSQGSQQGKNSDSPLKASTGHKKSVAEMVNEAISTGIRQRDLKNGKRQFRDTTGAFDIEKGCLISKNVSTAIKKSLIVRLKV